MADANDTPTLSEAMEMASSSLSSKQEETQQPEGETPEVVTEEAPATAEATEETAESEAEVEEKTPLDQFDPEKLPPELKPLYKNLMKGFTQGRQKDREELTKLRQELEQLRTSKTPSEQEKTLTPEEYIAKVAQETVTNTRIADYKAQALADYNNADPRLQMIDGEPGEQYDEVVDMYVSTELNRELEKYVQENGSELGFNHKELTKKYLDKWDQKVQAEVEKYIANQKKLAKKAEVSSGRFNPKSSSASVKPSGNMTLEQAMQAALAKAK